MNVKPIIHQDTLNKTHLLVSRSHEGTDTPAGSEDVQVVMSSFKSHVVKVRVAKKPGKQHMQLLSDDDDEGGGLWNSITR